MYMHNFLHSSAVACQYLISYAEHTCTGVMVYRVCFGDQLIDDELNCFVWDDHLLKFVCYDYFCKLGGFMTCILICAFVFCFDMWSCGQASEFS